MNEAKPPDKLIKALSALPKTLDATGRGHQAAIVRMALKRIEQQASRIERLEAETIAMQDRIAQQQRLLRSAFELLEAIPQNIGLHGLIDAAVGTGMTHLAYCGWMSAAREELNK